MTSSRKGREEQGRSRTTHASSIGLEVNNNTKKKKARKRWGSRKKKQGGERSEVKSEKMASWPQGEQVKRGLEMQMPPSEQCAARIPSSVKLVSSPSTTPAQVPVRNNKLRNNCKRGKKGGEPRAKQPPKKKGKTHGKEKKAIPEIIFRPSHPPSKRNKVLVWNSRLHHVPIKDEHAMKKIVFLGKGKEWGMLKDQPKERIAHITLQCKLHNMTLLQACSLRRHYILQSNKIPNSHERMGLGPEQVIRKAAEIFEDCVADFLKQKNIPYFTEIDQKRIQPKGMSTPDCLLKETVHLQWKDSKEVAEINWVECKMFYGASTIPLDNKSAVGKILSTASKYFKLFGPGVICFRNGCGDQLAARLRDLGVVAVDADALDLLKLDTHARDWCAGLDGTLLP